MSDSFKGYSCPNVKVKVSEVNYNVTDEYVECRLKISACKNNLYSQLFAIAENVIGMEPAINTQFEWINGSVYDEVEKAMRRANSENYLYMPECHVYKGVAVLKSGDVRDEKLAKQIAYKKAYRQMTSFYSSCYMNLLKRVSSYMECFTSQCKELMLRSIDANREIESLVED